MSPDQYRQAAEEFCYNELRHLCKEVVTWIDTGVLGEAPLFRTLATKCAMYAGLEHGRQVAENMVRTRAMRVLADS